MTDWSVWCMCGSRWRTEGLDPQDNYKNIGFVIKTGPDPLKITKLPIQHSMFGTIGLPVKRHLTVKRHLNGVSLAGRWWSASSDIWILPPLIRLKKVGYPLTKLSGSAHVVRIRFNVYKLYVTDCEYRTLMQIAWFVYVCYSVKGICSNNQVCMF